MWTLDTVAPLPLWRREPIGGAATMAFTTRRGGVSPPPYDSLNLGRSIPDRPGAVEENRLRVLTALGLDPARLATAGQVHGSRVARIGEPGHVPGCDALLTTVPDLAIAVTTADCMSLIYSAPGAVAVAHAGWRGIAEGMPLSALRAVAEACGVGPERVTVHFGPCIRACCYEVGEDVACRFDPSLLSPAAGRRRLDLPGASRLQLIGAGLPETAIEDVGACTACQPCDYFSHRRDRGIAGRHWAIAALRA